MNFSKSEKCNDAPPKVFHLKLFLKIFNGLLGAGANMFCNTTVKISGQKKIIPYLKKPRFFNTNRSNCDVTLWRKYFSLAAF